MNFLLLSDKTGSAAYGATVFFFLAMQCITLVRQPSHHDKRPKFSLPPLSLSWKTCLQWSEVPKIHAKFWHKKDLWQKTSRPGNIWRIRTYASLWALMGMYPWVLRDLADVIQEHSWQLTKCCGNRGSSWGLEEHKCHCYPQEGQDREPSETQASLPHTSSWEGVGAISLTKHFQTSKGQEGGWK